MCTVSMIGDQFGRDYPNRHPWVQPMILPGAPLMVPPAVSREEFDRLRADVDELKTLLLAAKRYDERTGQPDCEVDEKVALIRRLAELVGVDMSGVFPANNHVAE